MDQHSKSNKQKRHQVPSECESTDILKQLHKNQSEICDLYKEIVGLQGQEIEQKEKEASEMKGLIEALIGHIYRIDEILINYSHAMHPMPQPSWMERFWKKIISKRK